MQELALRREHTFNLNATTFFSCSPDFSTITDVALNSVGTWKFVSSEIGTLYLILTIDNELRLLDLLLGVTDCSGLQCPYLGVYLGLSGFGLKDLLSPREAGRVRATRLPPRRSLSFGRGGSHYRLTVTNHLREW